MRRRKCQAIKDGFVHAEGLFHRWADTGSATAALIELPNGNVAWWPHVIKFLEPEHPIVEVDESGKEPRWGEFHGWYQWNSGIESGAMGLVRYDDGTCGEVDPKSIRFLKGGSDGQ